MINAHTTGMRIGSLFAGYGGLDLAALEVFPGSTIAWHCEWEDAPAKILKHHWPDVPNYRDVTKVNWREVRPAAPIDILTGGFPCQDLSLAGRRAGIADGTRSGLWNNMCEAIDVLRPTYVLIENVRGLLSAEATVSDLELEAQGLGDHAGRPVLRALGAVLGNLADIGYDAWWTSLRASAIGAPHHRERVFILASPADTECGGRERRWPIQLERASVDTSRNDQNASDSAGVGWNEGWAESAGEFGGSHVAERSDDVPANAEGIGFGSGGLASGAGSEQSVDRVSGGDDAGIFGSYTSAIRRWEQLTRPAPAPTEPNKNGKPRLSAEFASWMMGLPAGWVTDPAIGISRADQLKAIGNGVVPQQAIAAYRFLLDMKVGA